MSAKPYSANKKADKARWGDFPFSKSLRILISPSAFSPSMLYPLAYSSMQAISLPSARYHLSGSSDEEIFLLIQRRIIIIIPWIKMKRFRLCNFATVIAVKDNEAHMLQTAWYYLLFFSSFFFLKTRDTLTGQSGTQNRTHRDILPVQLLRRPSHCLSSSRTLTRCSARIPSGPAEIRLKSPMR